MKSDNNALVGKGQRNIMVKMGVRKDVIFKLTGSRKMWGRRKVVGAQACK